MNNASKSTERLEELLERDIDDLSGEEYDEACKLIRAENAGYLELFEKDLHEAGLKDKTIANHLGNVEFFLNTYVGERELRRMEYGCYEVSGFLGDFFIRKCMWSTPASIKSNGASFKKFYKCMLDNSLIARESYDYLLATIKEEMAEWQDECKRFNDPDNFSNPFFDDLDALLGDWGEFDDSWGNGGVTPGKGDLSADSASGFTAFAGNAPADARQSSPSPDEPPSWEEIVDTFTLVLFYLTSWKERVGRKKETEYRRAWKSADWGALDRLRENYLIDCSNKAKSVTLTDEGVQLAEELLCALGLGHLTGK